MADVTYADALAALRAECGEPTFRAVDGPRSYAWWARDRQGSRGVILDACGRRVTLAVDDGRGVRVLAGTGKLTPLADAARDAGAWLRGRG